MGFSVFLCLCGKRFSGGLKKGRVHYTGLQLARHAIPISDSRRERRNRDPDCQSTRQAQRAERRDDARARSGNR